MKSKIAIPNNPSSWLFNQKAERNQMNRQKSKSTFRASLLTLTLMMAALGAGPAVTTAQKMVKDPATGKMLTAPEYGGSITLATKTEPDHTDLWYGHPMAPAVWYSNEKLGVADWTLDRNKFEFRSMFIPDIAIVGHLAESWEQPDPLTYVIKLRQGIHWHEKAPMNGRELTAEDVAFNWHRYLGLGSGYTEPSKFVAQWSSIDDVGIISATATDNYTLVFKTKALTLDGLRSILFEYSTHVLPPEVIKQHGEIKDWRKLVGTGPFELVDWVEGSSMSWTKNPNYWGFDEKYPQYRLPYVDQLRILVLKDNATQLAALRSGKVDLLGEITYTRVKSIDTIESLKKTNPDMQIEPTYTSSETSFAFDFNKVPFDDIRVRRAMQMALDLETINQTYFRGWAKTTPEGYTAAEVVGYTLPFEQWPEEIKQYYRYNPEGAEKLLDEAGLPRGADGIRFQTTLDVRNLYDLDFYQIAVEHFGRVGVAVGLNVLETADWATRLREKKYEAMTTIPLGNPWGKTMPLTHNISTSGWNPAGVKDPGYDKLMEGIANASTVEEQQRLSREALMFLIEKHYYMWGSKAATFNVNRAWVKGYNGEQTMGHVDNGFIIARLWIDQKLKKEMGF